MYFIACTFKIYKDSEPVAGFAVCSDADTPQTFINTDGLSVVTDGIWTYKLHHYKPWAKVENN